MALRVGTIFPAPILEPDCLSIRTTLTQAWAVLSARQRKAFFMLLPMMWLGMLVEMGTVSLFVPVMSELVTTIQGKTVGSPTGVLGWLPPGWGMEALLGLLMLVYLVKAAYFSWLLWLQAKYSYGVQADVSIRLYQAYLARDYALNRTRGTPELVRNLTQSSQVFALGVVSPCLSLLTELLVFAGLCGLIMYVLPLAALVVGVVVATLVGSVLGISRRPAGAWGQRRHQAEADRIDQARQGLDNLREIQLAHRQQAFVRSYEGPARSGAEASSLHNYLVELPRFWLEFLMVGGVVILVAVLLWQGEEMASILPVLGLVAAGAMRLVPSVGRLLTAFNTFRFSAAAVEEIHADLVCATPRWATVSVPAESTVTACPERLALSEVSVSHAGSAGGGLRSVSLAIGFGEFVGIIGPSGGGKSTLLNVMLGFLTPSAGQVTWNGQPLDQCLAEWRQRCGLVAQDLRLLNTSIGRNIALSPDGSDLDPAALTLAVARSGLGPWIESLPEGLDTPVGEDGMQLSGGQRQRVALARALYRSPSFLFLDEATSALDVDTEADTIRALLALRGQLTVVIVAHRLSTVAACDRVLVVEHGSVVDEGPASQVLARYGTDRDTVD